MNLFEAFVSITAIDNFSKSLTAAKALGVAAAGAIASAATAVANVTKQAVEAYSNYEQLVGGVETLFGAGGQSLEEYAASMGKSVSEVSDQYSSLMSAQSTVLADAKTAYVDAGLSMNDYMETVTGFSASLIQSLGGDTEAAASYANRAVIDMADNANKMGTSIQDIQNAYQGFAKQNYTMLDNLKLGYGGTQSEMQRLIADAAQLTDVQEKLGITVDANSMSFGNIVNAISVMQESMGIAGTTAKEATTTIQGSLNMLKASWENVLTAMADDGADFSATIDQLVESAGYAWDNIAPRVQIALEGVSQLVSELAPKIAEKIPGMVTEILPGIITAIQDIVSSVADILPELMESAVDLTTTMLDMGQKMISKLLLGLMNGLPQMISGAYQIVNQLATAISENIPTLLIQAAHVIEAFAESLTSPNSLSSLLDSAVAIMEGLYEGITAAFPVLIDTGLQVIQNLAQGIFDAIPELVAQLPQVITSILDYITTELPNILAKGTELISWLIDGILAAIPQLLAALPQVLNTLPEFISTNMQVIVDTGIEILNDLIDGILEAIPMLVEALPEIILSFTDFITSSQQTIIQAGIDILLALIDGLIKAIPSLIRMIPQIIVAIVQTLAQYFPKVLSSGVQILGQLISGIGQALPKLLAYGREVISAWIDVIGSAISGMVNIGKNIVDGIKQGIANAWSSLTGWFSKKISGLVSGVKGLLGIKSPSKVFAGIGGYMAEGLGEGWEDEFANVQKVVEDGLQFEAGDISVGKSSYSIDTTSSALEDRLANLEDLLLEYLPKLTNMQLVMDTGKVAGELAPAMDTALGKLSGRRARTT